MLRQRRKREQQAKWVVVAGVAAGITALAYVTYQMISRRRAAPPTPGLKRLERLVVKELREDEVLKRRGIEVAAVAPGLIELSGRVNSQDELQHAAEVVQSVPGVHTVLNRLDITDIETRLRRGRRKLVETEPALRWYGGGVGTGRRRQGRQTDPMRRDDYVDMVEHALEPDVADAIEDVVEERTTVITNVEVRADENNRS